MKRINYQIMKFYNNSIYLNYNYPNLSFMDRHFTKIHHKKIGNMYFGSAETFTGINRINYSNPLSEIYVLKYFAR